jgi:hypothetical protein
LRGEFLCEELRAVAEKTKEYEEEVKACSFGD